MLHRRIYGQALIGELFFGGKIVIQRILDTVPIRIGPVSPFSTHSFLVMLYCRTCPA